MKYSPRFSYTFTPASNRLDLSANVGFDIRGLLAVIDVPNQTVIYAVGSPGLGYSAISGNVLTLQASCGGLAAADALQFFYDDGSNVTTVQGNQSANLTGSITSASSTVGSLNVSNLNVVTVQIYGTYTGVSFTFQGSPDGTNWFVLQGSRVDNGQVSTGLISGSTANLAWDIPIGAWQSFRVQASAWASGTCNVVMGAQTFAYDPCPATIDQGPVSVGVAIPSNSNPVLLGGSDAAGVARQAYFTPKSTQGAYALIAQQMKDSGRNQTNYFSTTMVSCTATDALQSLTGYKGGVAVAATQTPAVITSGKTFRIVGITLTYVSTGTAGGYAKFTLRANTGGVAAIGSPAVQNWAVGAPAAVAGLSEVLHIDFGDGMEFAAGTGIGVSMVGYNATGTASAIGFGMVSLHGFEY